jgi:hypothetical protein
MHGPSVILKFSHVPITETSMALAYGPAQNYVHKPHLMNVERIKGGGGHSLCTVCTGVSIVILQYIYPL